MKKVGLVLGALLTVLGVSAAGAEGPLTSVVAHRLVSIEYQTPVADPTCPWSSNSGPLRPESRVLATVKFSTETLYVGYCEQNDAAGGGESFNGGSWTITRNNGDTLTGYVTGGSRQSSPGHAFGLGLVVTSGTGRFASVRHGKLGFGTSDDDKHGAITVQK